MFEIFSKLSHYMGSLPFDFCISAAEVIRRTCAILLNNNNKKLKTIKKTRVQKSSASYVVLQKLRKHSQKATVSK